ncbi:MAG TPA: DUF692 domain-containing protein [Candidatus Limnocylindrales bacterium]|nr:DUF692 domain-containing protein [Candidatus Limnocylindrales bacterium]
MAAATPTDRDAAAAVNAVGVGLRPVHYPCLLERPRTAVTWFEAISENYMDSHGRPLQVLERIRADFPIALHGVSLSIGYRPTAQAADAFAELRARYLRKLAALADRIDPFLVSDHLCWTGIAGANVHDLLPTPLTDEALAWIVEQIDEVQGALGRSIVLENVSSYLTYASSTWTEWDFLAEVARRSGCGILLDVNNVYVSARNHGFDARAYLDAIPPASVAQIHLAGHTDMQAYLFDTHSRPVCAEVWELFDHVIARLPGVPVLIEWDDDIPEFPALEAEAQRAAAIARRHHPGAEGAAA